MSKDGASLNVSVIIPHYGSVEGVRRSVESVLAAKPWEVILVLDGEANESYTWLTAAGVKVLELKKQSGPAKARNQAAQQASGDVLLFVDSDVVLPSDALTRVQQIFVEQPQLSALFGSYDTAPAASNFLSQYRNLLHRYVHQNGCERASTFWSGCGAIRRHVFEVCGGFDERFLEPSIEDIELGTRLVKAGYSIRLCKEIEVKHLKRWSLLAMLRADFFCRALPWSALILREKKMPNDLNVAWGQRLSVLATGLGVFAVLLTPWLSGGWRWAIFFAVLLIVLNNGFYEFLCRSRGLWFCLRAIPLHWLMFLLSGFAFTLVFLRSLLSGRLVSSSSPAPRISSQ